MLPVLLAVQQALRGNEVGERSDANDRARGIDGDRGLDEVGLAVFEALRFEQHVDQADISDQADREGRAEQVPRLE